MTPPNPATSVSPHLVPDYVSGPAAPPVRVLLVEDEEMDCLAFTRAVQRAQLPYDVTIAQDLATARHALAAGRFDVVLLDQILPDGEGFDLFDGVDDAAVILFVTRAEDERLAIQARQRGAMDYLLKDREREYLKLLPAAVTRALALRALRRESAEKTRLLVASFAGAPIGQALLTPEGMFLQVNPALGEIVGRSPEEFPGADLALVTPPEDLATAGAMLRERGSGGERRECRWQHRDGRTRWVQINATHLPAGPGVPAVVVWQVQDITESRQAAQALAESEARYRHLLESITGYSFTTTYENGRAVATTHRASSLAVTGYRPEEYAARPFLWLEMIEPADRPAVQAHIDATLRGEMVRPLEHRLRHRDGRLRWVRNTLAVRRDHSGAVIACDGLIEDITEQRQAQADRDEAGRFLQQVVDASPSMIFVVDGEGRTRFVNRAIAEYYGTTPEALLARATTEVHPAADEAVAFVSDDAEVIRTGCPLVKDERNTAPDGRVHWFHTVKVPLTRRDGTVDVLGISTDITALKEIEDALRASQRELAEAMEVARVAHWEYDVDRDEFTLNDRFYRLHGTTAVREGGLVMSAAAFAHRFFDPEQAGALTEEMDRARTATDPEAQWQIEHRVRRRDGATQHMQVGIAAERDAAGRVVRLRGASQEITALKEAELALRESEARFRTLTAAAFEGIGISERGVVLDANDQLLAMLGYTREEMIGQPVAHFVAPGDREQVMARLQAGREDVVEHHLLCADGTRLLVEARARQVQLGNRQVRLTALRDLTARKRAEEEKLALERRLLEAQRLESLGTLAGGVAHDFNNILAAIFGNIALARMDVPAAHPVQGVLTDISQLSERARDLVRQILAFSRPQSHQRVSVRLVTLVDEALKLVRATIPRTVELDVVVAPDAPSILADATQIHQVLVNLCTNAWQAIGPRPGRITVSTGRRTITAAEVAADPHLHEGRFAVIAVRDTGGGMDAATMQRVFEPFFTTKEPGQGTGLGLAVVHGMVQAHDGFVTVQSTPGQGALFEVYLPVGDDQCVAPHPVPVPAAVPRATVRVERILLVDDEVPVARICTLLLRRGGYTVTTCHAPGEALTVLGRDPTAFDLVITDLNMPGMDGIDFARAVHANRADIPVILATGFTASLTIEGAQKLGISALIQKPVDSGQLLETVREVLETPRGARRSG